MYWIKLFLSFLLSNTILSIKNNDSFAVYRNGARITHKLSYEKRRVIILIWIELLLYAGRVDKLGVLKGDGNVPITTKMLASAINERESYVKLALDVFEAYGMINRSDDGVITITNWRKYQGSKTHNEISSEANKRKSKSRSQKKNLSSNSAEDVTRDKDVTSQECHSPKKKREKKETTTSPNVDVVAEKSGSKTAAFDDDVTAEKSFTRPTLEEAKAYCDEMKYSVNPARFVDYYDQHGWNCVPDWRLRLDVWEKNAIDDSAAQAKADAKAQSSETISSFETDEAFEAALRRSYGEDYERFFEGS